MKYWYVKHWHFVFKKDIETAICNSHLTKRTKRRKTKLKAVAKIPNHFSNSNWKSQTDFSHTKIKPVLVTVKSTCDIMAHTNERGRCWWTRTEDRLDGKQGRWYRDLIFNKRSQTF